MGDELEVPDSSDQLYLSRGDEVNPHRPFLQGDVFEATTIPGVDGGPSVAIVTTHACDMRGDDGVALAEHLHLARVEEHPDAPKTLKAWFKYMTKEMPLPDLRGLGNGNFSAKLDLVGRVKTSDLALGQRIACLMPYGITILQQRIVNRSSRVQIATRVFQAQSAAVFEEADLMEEWIEASQKVGVPRMDAEKQFDEFLGEKRKGEPKLREQLRDAGKCPYVQRLVDAEIRSRFP